MPNPTKRRRSIRLPAYDYATAGAYFVTIVTQGRVCLFGETRDGKSMLSDAGQMVESVWLELPTRHPGVALDEFVVMPNHLHGIIVLTDPRQVGAGPRARPQSGRPQGVAPTPRFTLPDVVQRFKSFTTARYRREVENGRWPPFDRRLWQRNYYERVVRDEEELAAVRRYISENPLEWDGDLENPAFTVAEGSGSP